MEKEVNPPTDFFKGIKISLKSVLKHPDINLPKITNAVVKCNKIVIQVLMFMKLFLLAYCMVNAKRLILTGYWMMFLDCRPQTT